MFLISVSLFTVCNYFHCFQAQYACFVHIWQLLLIFYTFILAFDNPPCRLQLPVCLMSGQDLLGTKLDHRMFVYPLFG